MDEDISGNRLLIRKITLVKFTYPKGETGRFPLCPLDVLLFRIKSRKMTSPKRMRAGHQGFVTGILPEVDESLQNFSVSRKPELLKWKGTLKEQTDKILPLD